MPKGKRAWEMTFDEFLGPALIGPVFEIDGRTDESFELVWEVTAEDGLRELWRSPCGQFSIHDLEWDRQPSLVLFAPGDDGPPVPAGFYLTGMAWVDPDWRGRGLAVELVLTAAQAVRGSPTVNPDGMGFSEAGHAVHRKAHRVAVERAVEAGLPVPEEVLAEHGIAAPGWRR